MVCELFRLASTPVATTDLNTTSATTTPMTAVTSKWNSNGAVTYYRWADLKFLQ